MTRYTCWPYFCISPLKFLPLLGAHSGMEQQRQAPGYRCASPILWYVDTELCRFDRGWGLMHAEAGSNDGAIKIWRIDPRHVVRQAAAVIPK